MMLRLIEVLLPNVVAAILGWFLLRRIEGIKSEVARRSNFDQKWADLFFNASNEFMVSVEHYVARINVYVNSKESNGQHVLDLQRHVDETFTTIVENRDRIQRLALLAPQNGPAAEKSASDLYNVIGEFSRTKRINIDELRKKTDQFNRAARKAHDEMIAGSK